MTGEELYTVYSEERRVFGFRDVHTWDEIGPTERSIWNMVAKRITPTTGGS